MYYNNHDRIKKQIEEEEEAIIKIRDSNYRCFAIII